MFRAARPSSVGPAAAIGAAIAINPKINQIDCILAFIVSILMMIELLARANP
jgi:hypothetical protein